MKKNVNKFLLIVVCFTCYLFADITNDFYFRPYPVLLVHGFNTYVGGTWGINTEKIYKENKDLPDNGNKLSTRIPGDNGLAWIWEWGDAEKVDFGELLMRAFSKNGFIDNNYINNGKNIQDYKDYWGNVTSIVQSRQDLDIWEEDNSYQGINHSFVEVYCPYYFNESDDQAGVAQAQFRGNGINSGEGMPYSISEFNWLTPSENNFGGQTQLVRIRIIQLLNEYYGPWKWVNDPTAKINIVCHSNGGIIVTNALKHDEDYYNGGYPGPIPNNCGGNSFWADPSNTSGFYITGLGFRLRDHINKVITISSPFTGSPLADKDGKVSPMVKELLFSASTVCNAEYWTGEIIPGLSSVLSITGPGGVLAILSKAFEEIAAGQIGGFSSPVMWDLGEGSDFHNYMKGDGLAPTYSPEHYLAGQQIPYINYTSRAMHFMPWTRIIQAICVGIGNKNMIASTWWFPFPAPWKAAPWYNMANEMGKLTNWCGKSDAIAPIESQDIGNLYSYSTREIRIRTNGWHSEVVNLNRNGVRSDLNRPISITITNAIGENQTNSGKTKCDTVSRTLTFHDSIHDRYYPHQIHPIVKFNGFCSSNPNELWPATNSDSIITMGAASGRPITIVGIIEAYFINRSDFRVRVNNGPWQPLTFNQDYGDFATRFVDRNNDDKIDQNDFPGGAYIFAGVNPDSFKVGENTVTFKLFGGDLTPPKPANIANRPLDIKVQDPTLSCHATIMYGNPVTAYESDAAGNQQSPVLFFRRPVKWDYSAGGTKTVYVSFDKQVSGPVSLLNRVSIVSAGGAIPLEKVSGNPSAGQFAVLVAPANGNNMFKIVLSGGQLDKTGSVANQDQMMHLEMEEEASGVVSHAYVPFYIDNEAPVVRVYEPVITGDFNNDGFVDTNDICSPVLDTVQQDCDNICAQNGYHGDSCLEAKALCRQIKDIVQQPKQSFCDGIDNDFNGFIDGQDKGEFDRMQYYSPKFVNGILTSKPVILSFTISDNLASSFKAKTLEWRVYKVYSENWNSAGDQLVFSKPIAGKLDFEKDYDGTWRFEGINTNNPDGLYCAVVYVQDQAGNETFSAPGYFIIDTKPPEITILHQWEDENHSGIFGLSSKTFMCKLVPGNGYTFPNKYASEADEVTAVFKGVGYWSFYGEKSITIPINYQDLTAYDADGDSVVGFSPDGRIDPTTIFLQKGITGLAGFFNVPDAHYQVTLTAKDKAGNEKQYVIPNEVIVETGNTTPATDRVDIGNSITGHSSFNDNTNEDTLATTQDGLGSDAHDRYNYSYLKITGDFTFTVRVDSIYNTSTDAMAGIMVRKGLFDDDVHALIGNKVSNDVVFRTRMVKGDPAVNQSVVPGYIMPNVWLKAARKNDTLRCYASHDGITYTLIGTTVIGTDDVYVGYFHTPNCTGCTGRATFSEIKFSPTSVAPITLEVQSVGSVTSPYGEWNSTFDRYMLGGASAGTGGTSDALEFSYMRLGGNFAFTAKAASLDNTAAWAKAGIMARTGLAANAISGMAYVTPANGAGFEYRTQTGGTTTNVSAPGYAPGTTWLRVKRIGSMLYGYAGTDSSNLSLISQFAIGSDTLYVGMAHTSGNASFGGYGVFTGMKIDPIVVENVLLSQNKPAFASSYENNSYPSSFITDGDTTNHRWSSKYTDNQWAVIDLGSLCQISRIKIFWQTASAKEYELQVSDNGELWSVVNHVINGSAGQRIDDFTPLATHGRYVRVKGIQRNTSYGYSIYEIKVFGIQGTETPSIKLTGPSTPVAVSSTEDCFPASNAVDGNLDTRWGSSWCNNPNADNQWIYVDLGTQKTISCVYLQWEAAYGKDYSIEVSNNGSSWTTVTTVTNGDGNNDLFIGMNAVGRYVRMLGIHRGTSYGYSLYEFEVYGNTANQNEVYSQWQHSAQITLNTATSGANVLGNVSNYPVLLRLDPGNFTGLSQVKPNGADIRFAKSDGTHLNYQIERWLDGANDNDTAEIWVKVDTVYGNNATQFIKMYWGKSDATDNSSGMDVFSLANGYAGVWHLNNNPAGTTPQISDAAGSLNGTCAGDQTATDLVNCVAGKGLHFDGTNDRINFGNGQQVDITGHNSITFSVWAKFNAMVSSVRYDIIKKGDHQFGLQKINASDNKVQFVVYDGTYCIAKSNNNVDTATWYYFTGVYNGANDSVFLYVNGVKQATAARASNGISSSRDDALEIGRCSEGLGSYFNGKMDEAVLSKAARSMDWIKLSYENQKTNQTFVHMPGH